MQKYWIISNFQKNKALELSKIKNILPFHLELLVQVRRLLQVGMLALRDAFALSGDLHLGLPPREQKLLQIAGKLFQKKDYFILSSRSAFTFKDVFTVRTFFRPFT